MGVIAVRVFEVYGLLLLLRAFVRVETYFWMQMHAEGDKESDDG